MYRSPVRHTERLHLGHDTLSVVARTFAREAVPVTLVPTEAWEAWLMAVGTTLAEIEDIDGELIDAVDGFAQEVAR